MLLLFVESSTCSQQETPAQLTSTSAEGVTLAKEPSRGEPSLQQEMALHQDLMSEEGKQTAPELSQESSSQPATTQGHLARAPITLTHEEESGKNVIKIYVIITLVILAIILLSILIFKVK